METKKAFLVLIPISLILIVSGCVQAPPTTPPVTPPGIACERTGCDWDITTGVLKTYWLPEGCTPTSVISDQLKVCQVEMTKKMVECSKKALFIFYGAEPGVDSPIYPGVKYEYESTKLQDDMSYPILVQTSKLGRLNGQWTFLERECFKVPLSCDSIKYVDEWCPL